MLRTQKNNSPKKKLKQYNFVHSNLFFFLKKIIPSKNRKPSDTPMEYFAKFTRNLWRSLTSKIYETLLYNSLYLSESIASHEFFFQNKFVFHSYSSYLYNPCNFYFDCETKFLKLREFLFPELRARSHSLYQQPGDLEDDA